MALPLWMTFWVAMSPAVCGGPSNTISLTATDQLATKIAPTLTLGGTRQFDTVIEACYWVIKSEPNTYRDTSQLYIYLDSSTTANMFVFAGNDRRNATLIVEQNGTVPFGAAVRVPISSGAIVVLQARNGFTSGAA